MTPSHDDSYRLPVIIIERTPTNLQLEAGLLAGRDDCFEAAQTLIGSVCVREWIRLAKQRALDLAADTQLASSEFHEPV